MIGLTPDDLPESLSGIVDVIGLPATLKLVETMGGLMNVYVPKDIQEDHQLVRAMGINAARKLAVVYGGDVISNIPKCLAALRRIRNTEISERHGQGVTAPELAAAYGLTERMIWKILAGSEEDDQQQSLF